ncbi:hypothetical protein M8J75_001713 [Diaphorina citri]|nr:hypothetical protein M8J75_001713 [Diaphorina citri]
MREDEEDEELEEEEEEEVLEVWRSLATENSSGKLCSTQFTIPVLINTASIVSSARHSGGFPGSLPNSLNSETIL